MLKSLAGCAYGYSMCRKVRHAHGRTRMKLEGPQAPFYRYVDGTALYTWIVAAFHVPVLPLQLYPPRSEDASPGYILFKVGSNLVSGSGPLKSVSGGLSRASLSGRHTRALGEETANTTWRGIMPFMESNAVHSSYLIVNSDCRLPAGTLAAICTQYRLQTTENTSATGMALTCVG